MCGIVGTVSVNKININPMLTALIIEVLMEWAHILITIQKMNFMFSLVTKDWKLLI